MNQIERIPFILNELGRPFPEMTEEIGIETYIVPYVHDEMLFVSKIWAVEVIRYKTRKKYLTQIIDSFGSLLLKQVGYEEYYRRSVESIRAGQISRNISNFSRHELSAILQVLDAYQKIREAEYPFASKVMSQFGFRLHQPENPPSAIPHDRQDEVSDLAVNFLCALMDEKLTITAQKPDPAKLERVRAYTLDTFTPQLVTALRGNGSHEWRHKLSQVINLVNCELGKKLSQLEKEWHIALKIAFEKIIQNRMVRSRPASTLQ